MKVGSIMNDSLCLIPEYIEKIKDLYLFYTLNYNGVENKPSETLVKPSH